MDSAERRQHRLGVAEAHMEASHGFQRRRRRGGRGWEQADGSLGGLAVADQLRGRGQGDRRFRVELASFKRRADMRGGCTPITKL